MMWAFLLVLAGVVVLGALVWRYVQSLDSNRKLADAISGVLMRAEARGVFPIAPAYERCYLKDYPHLKILEDNYPVMREECEKLLGLKEKMTDMEMLGGSYTAGGIHTAKWKTFMFKSRKFVEDNCRDAPHPIAPIDVLPSCPERLIETRPCGQQEEGDQADVAVPRAVLLQHTHQPLQLLGVQVVFHLVVGVEQMHT